jgi:hypothetical protein
LVRRAAPGQRVGAHIQIATAPAEDGHVGPGVAFALAALVVEGSCGLDKNCFSYLTKLAY